jgi:hypothetical protein
MSRRARVTDPFTSWAAACEATGIDPKVRLIVKHALESYGPLTHDQLIEVVNRVRPCSPSGVRTRTRELVDAGEVERVPSMVAKSRYGRAALLWQVVTK